MIIVVGIGRFIKQSELNGMATNGLTSGGSNVWLAENFNNLDSLRDQLTTAVCNSKSARKNRCYVKKTLLDNVLFDIHIRSTSVTGFEMSNSCYRG